MNSELVESGRHNNLTSSTYNFISVKRWSANFYSTISEGIVSTPKSLMINDINYSINQSKKRKNGYYKYCRVPFLSLISTKLYKSFLIIDNGQ